MKILLVNLNREHLPDPVPPIGLVYVGGALLERNHYVELCDLCFADDPDTVLKAHLTAM